MKTLMLNLICAATLCALTSMASAEIAIIVNHANNDDISKETIQKLYLAKARTFPSGKIAIPVDQTEGSPIRIEFIKKIIEKDEAQMKAYWSRLIFTGKGVPPNILANDSEVKELVSRNLDGIGFINSGSIDDTVKVIGKF